MNASKAQDYQTKFSRHCFSKKSKVIKEINAEIKHAARDRNLNSVQIGGLVFPKLSREEWYYLLPFIVDYYCNRGFVVILHTTDCDEHRELLEKMDHMMFVHVNYLEKRETSARYGSIIMELNW